MSKNDKTLDAYIRVSRKYQNETTQIREIKKYCKTNNIKLDKIFIDKGEAGWDPTRKEFQKMLKHLDKADGLLLQHSDRFSRDDPIDTIILYREINRKNKEVLSIMEGSLSMHTLEEQLILYLRLHNNAARIRDDKVKQKMGIQNYIEKHGRWGPKVKKLDLDTYNNFRAMGHNKKSCAILMGMSYTTLYRRLKEVGVD